MSHNEQKPAKEVIVIGCGTSLRVTRQIIEKLLEGVSYHTHLVPGTTTILATAIMPSGFTLGTAESACLVPEDFKLQQGIEIAIAKARALAVDALWQFEGYRLKQTMHELKQDHGRDAIERMRESVKPHSVEPAAPK
jgi:hypothetical protein